MTIQSVNAANAAASAAGGKPASGFAALGATDFLKLMTAQLQQQDPTAPVDQKEMLAQMAQFSALAGTTEMGDTLKAISAKLDVLISAQSAAALPSTTDSSQES